MLEIEWKKNDPAFQWQYSITCRAGNVIGAVGVRAGEVTITAAVWRDAPLRSNSLIYTRVRNELEGKEIVENYIRANLPDLVLELCEECYTRHKPGENPLCPL